MTWLRDRNCNPAAGRSWRGFAAAALFLAPLMGGCGTVTHNTNSASPQGEASMPALPTPRLSLDEIVALSRQGVDAQALIARIQVSGSHYRLTAAEVISIRERGVHVAVIDHMLTAERHSARAGSSQPAEKIQTRPAKIDQQTFVAALYHGF